MLISFNEIDKLNLKINGVIHIGGHIGEEIPLYLNRNFKVAIFEPQRECYDKIIDHPNVQKYNVALGAKKEIVKLNLASNKESSSILKPKLHLIEHPHISFNETIEVPQETLDSYNFTDYDFINLDVQGYEMEVLKGATNTLKHVKYIYTEVNEKTLYENCVLISDLDSWLEQYSFKRVLTEMTRYGWGDAFYVKG